MRKDSECFFGALKGRFRSLKVGCRLRGPEACDRLFLTCVALHNYLLHYDGLDKVWINGVHLPLSREEQYDGEFGDHDAEDQDYIQRRARDADPSLFGRILDEAAPLPVGEFRRYDSGDALGNSEGDDDALGNSEGDDEDELLAHYTNRSRDKITVAPVGPVGGAVHEHHGHTLRDTLVTHWDIAWKRGEIQWPERDRVPTSVSTPPSFG